MNAQVTQLSLFETRSSTDPFAVRVSPRARRLTARVHVGGRVEIVVPVGVSAKAVRDFVQRFTPWIDRKVALHRCHLAVDPGSEALNEIAHRLRAHPDGNHDLDASTHMDARSQPACARTDPNSEWVVGAPCLEQR